MKPNPIQTTDFLLIGHVDSIDITDIIDTIDTLCNPACSQPHDWSRL